MSDSPDDEIRPLGEGPASSFGWLRRKDLEAEGGLQVWEAPDGQLMQSMSEPTLARWPGLFYNLINKGENSK